MPLSPFSSPSSVFECQYNVGRVITRFQVSFVSWYAKTNGLKSAWYFWTTVCQRGDGWVLRRAVMNYCVVEFVAFKSNWLFHHGTQIPDGFVKLKTTCKAEIPSLCLITLSIYLGASVCWYFFADIARVRLQQKEISAQVEVLISLYIFRQRVCRVKVNKGSLNISW